MKIFPMNHSFYYSFLYIFLRLWCKSIIIYIFEIANNFKSSPVKFMHFYKYSYISHKMCGMQGTIVIEERQPAELALEAGGVEVCKVALSPEENSNQERKHVLLIQIITPRRHRRFTPWPLHSRVIIIRDNKTPIRTKHIPGIVKFKLPGPRNKLARLFLREQSLSLRLYVCPTVVSAWSGDGCRGMWAPVGFPPD